MMLECWRDDMIMKEEYQMDKVMQGDDDNNDVMMEG